MATENSALLRKFFKELQGSAPLLTRYRADPALFFTQRGVRFFPCFTKLFNDLYRQRVKRAVLLAPRGGGKTFGAALLATALFLFKDFDIGIVAGSETQALTLFSYIAQWLGQTETAEFITELKRSAIVGITGNRIVARTASARSIRGLHLGRGRRGALLIIDEEAEAEENVVRAARYTVRTAAPALVLRSSTYHKLTGSFAELVENRQALGYRLYKWDSFDIAKPCQYSCSSCPVDEFKNTYCRGKAKSSRGWVDIDEIVAEWRDASKEIFEVEVMGMRPSSSGCVIAPQLLDEAIIDMSAEELDKPDATAQQVLSYKQGSRTTAVRWCGLDWGFAGMTAVVGLELVGDVVNVIYTEAFHRQGIEDIVARLKQLRCKFGIREIFADSSHPFENLRLRDEGFAVWGASPETSGILGVPFVSFKKEGVAILCWLFENKRIRIPSSAKLLLSQLGSWRRDNTGHIVKKADHFPDALLAAMMKIKIMGIGRRRSPGLQSASKRFFHAI